MRDHYYVGKDGSRTAVADLPTPMIHEILRDGVYVVHKDHPGERTESVVERLQLELFIRERGLRTP